jgi:predicted TPR repeat methyltransferase
MTLYFVLYSNGTREQRFATSQYEIRERAARYGLSVVQIEVGV